MFVCALLVGTILLAQSETQQWRQAMAEYNYSKAIELITPQIDSLRENFYNLQDSTAVEVEAEILKNLLLQKANCQKSLYKFNEAIVTLDEALQIGGIDAATLANIAECHRLSGNDIASYMFYSNAVGMSPENIFFRIQKAMLHYKMEEFQNCIVEGREILKRDTINQILITVGNSFNRMNQTDSALVYYSNAYRRNPKDYRTLEKMSNIFLSRQMFDTVIVLAGNYLEMDSANVVINPIKGLAQYGLKDYKNSYDTFKKSLDYGCDPLSGYYYLGLCKFMEKDYGTARAWFKKASQLDSTDVNLMYYQGECYAHYQGGFHKEAEEYFSKAEAMIQPDSTMMYKIYSSRGDMYMRERKLDKVIQNYKVAEKYGQLNSVQLATVGYAYRLKKDYQNAIKYYEEYYRVGKQDSANWKFVEAEMAFIKEELFMQEGKEPLK